MSQIAKTLAPPYYAVIFTSKRTQGDRGYGKTADKMVSMAEAQAGFLGAESLRDDEGFGMTISYWKSMESIEGWRKNLSHMEAKQKGKDTWYSEYKIRICRVEWDNFFERAK